MKPIPIIEFDERGDISTLYTEEVGLREIGRLTDVRRASHIRFNEEDQVWEVIHGSTGEVVHRCLSRVKAVDWEVVNFGPGGPHFWGVGT